MKSSNIIHVNMFYFLNIIEKKIIDVYQFWDTSLRGLSGQIFLMKNDCKVMQNFSSYCKAMSVQGEKIVFYVLLTFGEMKSWTKL